MPSAREVLVENKCRWRQPAVLVGDRAFITLPTTAQVESCFVTLPDGDRVELKVRRRDDGLTADHCAALETRQQGQHRYVFALSNGKQALGSFTVHSRRRRAKR
jgi:hypothetical protein